MAKIKDGDSRAADIIKNWIRNRGTLEFIGIVVKSGRYGGTY